MSFPVLRPDVRPVLHAALITSPHASATLGHAAPPPADEFDGGVSFFFAADFAESGVNLQPEDQSTPILAGHSVTYWGQPVGLVVGDSWAECRRSAAAVHVNWHPTPALLSVAHASAMNEFHGEPRRIVVGEPAAALAAAPRRLEGALVLGSQAIHHRQPLSALADPDGPEGWCITVPTTNPAEVRSLVAQVLRLPASRVTIQAEATSGGEGRRDWDAARVAALAALAALRSRGPVRLALDHAQDSAFAGQRHGADVHFHIGFDDEGHLLALDAQIALDGGCDAADAEAAGDRLLCHALSGYEVPNLSVSLRVCRSHRLCRASLPGEGVAQGTLIAEEILSRLAQRLGRPAHEIRALNLASAKPGWRLPFGQKGPATNLGDVWERALRESGFTARHEAIQAWNESNSCYKRGLAAVPVVLGLGELRIPRQRAAVDLRFEADGSATLLLGAADDRSGLAERVASRASDRLGLPLTSVRASFDSLGRLGPAASPASIELFPQAVDEACARLLDHLRPVAALMIAARSRGMVDPRTLRFSEGGVDGLPLAELLAEARRQRLPLAVEVAHSTSDTWWEADQGRGEPFHGFVCGAAVAEVQIDAFTGEAQVLRSDLFFPAREGDAFDHARLGRAWNLGHGWMLLESTQPQSQAPPGATPREVSTGTYALPGFADLGFDWRFHPLPAEVPPVHAGEDAGVMLAVAIRDAAREAVRAFAGDSPVDVEIPVPATPETVLRMLRELSRKLAETRPKEKKAPAPKPAAAQPAPPPPSPQEEPPPPA